jgi:hypothetical protein
MSLGHRHPPFLLKDGRILQVRGPTKQDERSLSDQRIKVEKFLIEHCDYPIDLTALEGRQSDELLDREELGEPRI